MDEQPSRAVVERSDLTAKKAFRPSYSFAHLFAHLPTLHTCICGPIHSFLDLTRRRNVQLVLWHVSCSSFTFMSQPPHSTRILSLSSLPRAPEPCYTIPLQIARAENPGAQCITSQAYLKPTYHLPAYNKPIVCILSKTGSYPPSS